MNISNCKKSLFFCFFLIYFSIRPLISFSQKSEIGGLIGPSYYWGDIVNNVQLYNVRLSGTVFYRKYVNERISWRANLAYARIRGADSVSKGSVWQINRNLSFWTDIVEASGVVEYNLLPDYNVSRSLNNRVVPYVFGGLGVFYFNPKAINPITGEELALQPLKTNGVSYSRVALCIPMGIGVRYYINRRWQIGLEFGMRYSLSSYIDDVNGNSVYPDLNELESDDARIMTNTSLPRLAQIRASGDITSYSSAGKERGKNEIISDVYFISGITLSYRLWPGQAVRCPRVY